MQIQQRPSTSPPKWDLFFTRANLWDPMQSKQPALLARTHSAASSTASAGRRPAPFKLLHLQVLVNAAGRTLEILLRTITHFAVKAGEFHEIWNLLRIKAHCACVHKGFKYNAWIAPSYCKLKPRGIFVMHVRFTVTNVAIWPVFFKLWYDHHDHDSHCYSLFLPTHWCML